MRGFVLVPGGRYFGLLDLQEVMFATSYKVLSWAGVMAAGYGFGTSFCLTARNTSRGMIGLGIALTLAFIASATRTTTAILRTRLQLPMCRRPMPRI